MGAIISLLVIAGVSLVIVRIAATALLMTGLSWDVASFQAHSAFFGVGFTTAEAELAVSTPQRRTIIKHLMVAGNLGLTAGLGSVIIAFVKADGIKAELNVLLWILAGLGAIVLIAIVPPTRRLLDWTIRKSLKRAGVLHAADFGLLLKLHAGYSVCERAIGPASLLTNQTLAQTKLGSQGVVVLGISRLDPAGLTEYIGTPRGSAIVRAGDLLTIYGTPDRIAELVR